MKEVRYFFVPDAQNSVELPSEEAIHAVRVLRMKEGDELFLMDGNGMFYRAMVDIVTAKRCTYIIKEKLPQEKTWNGHLHLAIAPTKDMGRIEWMVEKATEIGFDEITFLDCKFSERKQIRTDRIEKIVVSAVKQSRKGWKPVVNGMTPFLDFIAHSEGVSDKFICHCYNEVAKDDFLSAITAKEARGNDILVMVGPEGDFSIDEVKAAVSSGFKSVTLGESRLRTETAGLEAVAMSQLARRKKSNVFYGTT